MLPEGFLRRMRALLGETEYEAFLAAAERPRSVALRFNPLKTTSPPELPEFGLTPEPRSKAQRAMALGEMGTGGR